MSKHKQSIYLDHAAATPLDPQVLAVMQPYLKQDFYNPSSLYRVSRLVKGAVEDARWQVAQTLGAKKTEVIFTAGGTESVNLAILGVIRSLSRSIVPYKFVTTAIEHDSVLACLPVLKREGHETSVIPVNPDGLVDVKVVERAIDDHTILVSVMYANNEIGTIQPIGDIAKSIQAIRQDRLKRKILTPLYFHTDACQAAGALDLHVSRLGIDLMSFNGSKIYGPKQVGGLYVRTGTPLEPIIYGGGQERGLRSGTENVAGIIGFATAIVLAQARRESETERLTELKNYAWLGLKTVIPDLTLNGHPTKRLSNNINITIPGINGETAVLYLDQEGILASTGSACSTGKTDPSHVLLAIGCSRAQASASLRFTTGLSSAKADIDQLIKVLPHIVKRLRQLAHTT